MGGGSHERNSGGPKDTGHSNENVKKEKKTLNSLWMRLLLDLSGKKPNQKTKHTVFFVKTRENETNRNGPNRAQLPSPSPAIGL